MVLDVTSQGEPMLNEVVGIMSGQVVWCVVGVSRTGFGVVAAMCEGWVFGDAQVQVGTWDLDRDLDLNPVSCREQGVGRTGSCI